MSEVGGGAGVNAADRFRGWGIRLDVQDAGEVKALFGDIEVQDQRIGDLQRIEQAGVKSPWRSS